MKKNPNIFLITLLLVFFLGACSVEIAQTSIPATPRRATATETPAPTATQAPPTETAIPPTETPVESGANAESTPTDTPTPTETLPPFDFPPVDTSTPDVEITTDWQELGLQGRVTFMDQFEGSQRLMVFDFESGELSTIFLSPENTWLTAASTNPNRSDILIAFAPTPEAGQPQYGYTDLYRLPAGGDPPSPLLERSEEQEAFFGSFYGPAGEFIYYTWFLADSSVNYGFRYHISRLDLATGQTGIVVEDAFWQTVSKDNSKLAYVTFNPDASAGDPDLMMIADPDGNNPQAVLDPDEFPTVDAPFFSPDGEYLYFSAVSETQSNLSWLDKLMGVRIALAHNVPSDWWRVHLSDGEAERITEILDQGLNGSFSPDGAHIAFISSTGLWVMKLDGSDLIQVIDGEGFYGNLEWIE